MLTKATLQIPWKILYGTLAFVTVKQPLYFLWII